MALSEFLILPELFFPFGKKDTFLPELESDFLFEI